MRLPICPRVILLTLLLIAAGRAFAGDVDVDVAVAVDVGVDVHPAGVDVAVHPVDVHTDDVIITLNETDLDDHNEMTIVVRRKLANPLSPSTRVIKSDEFHGKYADLPSVLEAVSGLGVRSMGGYGQYAEAAVRGSSAKGVRIYLDGVLLNSASAGAVDLSKIPLDRIREIRVTKSTSGLRQMGAGMGGVIELFTDAGTDVNTNRDNDPCRGEQRSPAITGVNTPCGDDRRPPAVNGVDIPRIDRPRSPAMMGVNFEAGNYGYVKGGLIVRPSNKKIRQQTNIDIAKSDNDYPFTHDNGTTIPTRRDPDPAWDDTLMYKRNNHYRSIDAAHSVSVDIAENHRITQQISAGAYTQGLFVYHYREDQSGSTGGSNVLYSVDYQGRLSDRLAVGGEASGVYRHSTIKDPDGHFSLGGGGMELESGGGAGDFLADAKYLLAENFYLAGMAGTRFERHVRRNRALDGRPEMSRYEYRAGAEAGYVTGAASYKSLGTAGSSNQSTPNKSASNKAGLTTESTLRAVYKYEIDTMTAGLGYLSPEGRKYTLGYPLAEAVFRLNVNPVTVRLSAAASKRSPTFFERFGWSGGFLSNPDLREETRVEADAGVSVDMGEWSAAASVFAGKVNGKIKSIPQRSFVKVMNFADTDFYGAELDVGKRVFHIISVELSAAYLNSVVAGAADPGWVGRTEPFVPEWTGFLKTEADIGRFNIGHGIKYEGECYLGIDNGARRQSQSELSAWASCKIAGFLTLRYRVNNYLNTANFDFLDNPMPRRMHVVSAGINL